MAPIIDTLEVLDLIYQALDRCKDPGGKDLELHKTACSAFSALMPYLRHPKAPVQQKHYDAIDLLRRTMKEAA